MNTDHILKTVSKISASAGNFFKNNIKEYRREETARKKEDDIIKAAAALWEAEVEDKRIVELLCKYWDISRNDAGLFLIHGKHKAGKHKAGKQKSGNS